MGIGELILLAVLMSMDAFAVSLCKGLSMQKASLKAGVICGGWFGAFQALMPLAGFFLGSLFADYIEAYDHWVSFGLLALIGANMLKEAFEKKEDCCECQGGDLSVKVMFPMAVATSIDALAAGVGLAMERANIWLAITLIGTITFAFCVAGVKIGSVFGTRFQKKAQIFGGVMLILLGLKMLLEGLGVLQWLTQWLIPGNA